MEQEPVSLVHPWFTPFRLYIFRFLHQTTTIASYIVPCLCCISFVSYIKPQPFRKFIKTHMGCISFVSYIKPQRCIAPYLYSRSCISFVSYIKPQHYGFPLMLSAVVYLSFPTSNHNIQDIAYTITMLYIFRFLHQTTTYKTVLTRVRELYIFRFLHQTTTSFSISSVVLRCISFVSYIKPQPIVNYCLYINSLCCID